ncbi:hypothetical protein GJAV_G00021580 [Gymnothorax javanicus]|nr:hypothetical protein GJAV_G00021580 [Gymnothorax javanicus]
MATSKNANAKGKKVVSQEELRRLMRAKQGETADQKKRIESPFPTYNSLGNLSCVLCCVPVKSNLLWQAHVLGKQHKQKVAELKGAKQIEQTQQTSAGPVLKRKTTDSENTPQKKLKADKDVASRIQGVPADAQKTASSSRPGLVLLGNYDDDDEDESDDDDVHQGGDVTGQSNKKSQGSAGQKSEDVPSETVSGLPADFFDGGLPPGRAISHSGSVLKPDEPEKPVVRKTLLKPCLRAFFDDPVTDAKVRKVDAPKDLMDKEWDEFQKELRQVNSASEAIVAEDDEEGRLERQIDEIDEQIECYRRVEVLREKRDVVKDLLQKRSRAAEQQEESSEDEDELQQLLCRDWRAKGVLS